MFFIFNIFLIAYPIRQAVQSMGSTSGQPDCVAPSNAACRWFVGRIAAAVVHLSGRSRLAQQGHLVRPSVLGLPGPSWATRTDRRGIRYRSGGLASFDPNVAAFELTLLAQVAR